MAKTKIRRPLPQEEERVSVIMTLRFTGDPDKLEQLAAEQGDMLRGISERAQAQGVIAHRFYASGDQIMVVDEWPDQGSFESFFASEQEHIGPLMAQVATSEPEITFWRKLETGDDVGWQ
jgi:quinol monooxygenase YgiN